MLRFGSIERGKLQFNFIVVTDDSDGAAILEMTVKQDSLSGDRRWVYCARLVSWGFHGWSNRTFNEMEAELEYWLQHASRSLVAGMIEELSV